MSKSSVALVVILLLVICGSIIGARNLGARYTEEQRYADSLAGELAAQELEVQGWEATFATTTKDLEAQIAEQDRAMSVLVSEITAARGDLVLANELIASLQGQVGDTIFVEVAPQCTDSYSGNYDDGLINGTWRTTIHTTFAEMMLQYSATVGIELFQSRMGDGRWLVAARATDSRVDIGSVRSVFDPPPPIVEYKLSKTKALISILIGMSIGLVVGGG